jgi:hypothetical protein
MTIYVPGQTVPLTAEFFTSPGGLLTDVPSLTIAITSPTAAVEVATTSTGITHAATGVYRYSWTVPAGAATGDHLVLWTATGGITATELVTVTSALSAWCTAADVVAYTGATVTDAVIGQASSMIDLHIGRTYYELVSNPDGGQLKVGRRDRQWLTQACAYQAAWMAGQPDIYQRLDLTQVALDHRSLSMRDPALTLAPLARKALKRVSWLRSRSLHVRTPFTDGIGPLSPNLVAESNDAYETWSALGAG